MIPRAAHQSHQPWSRHIRCMGTKPLTREAEKVCPASFLAGQTSHVVELGGFEPPTFSLRTRRATNCAIAPGAGLILASSPVVLASSVAVSPPTAPEPRYDRNEDHARPTLRPRAAPRGWHRGRWGGRALPRPPPERGCRREPSAGAQEPAPRCRARPPGRRTSAEAPEIGRAHV